MVVPGIMEKMDQLQVKYNIDPMQKDDILKHLNSEPIQDILERLYKAIQGQENQRV